MYLMNCFISGTEIPKFEFKKQTGDSNNWRTEGAFHIDAYWRMCTGLCRVRPYIGILNALSILYVVMNLFVE